MKEKKEKPNSKNGNNSWVIFISIATFILSLTFSFISNTGSSQYRLFPSDAPSLVQCLTPGHASLKIKCPK